MSQLTAFNWYFLRQEVKIATLLLPAVSSRGNCLNAIRYLVPLFVFCVVLNVSAQTNQGSSSTDDDGGWVVAAYLGGAHTAASDLTISQPTLGTNLTFLDVGLSSQSFSSPLYYGLRGGYFLRRFPFLGFEAEFIHLKVFADPQQQVRVTGLRRNIASNTELRLGEIVQRYSISHGVNLLLFNVAARHRINTQGRLILTARAGLGPTLPHTESVIEGRAQEQYERGRLAWQASGGAEFRLWRRLYALGEYKFTRTRQRGKVALGSAESILRTSHGVFGVSYHF
jgi:Outer membrane protein beta-barrel domain